MTKIFFSYLENEEIVRHGRSRRGPARNVVRIGVLEKLAGQREEDFRVTKLLTAATFSAPGRVHIRAPPQMLLLLLITEILLLDLVVALGPVLLATLNWAIVGRLRDRVLLEVLLHQKLLLLLGRREVRLRGRMNDGTWRVVHALKLGRE